MAIRTDVLVSINAKDNATKALKGISGSFKNLRAGINQHSVAITASLAGITLAMGSLAKKSVTAASDLEESINAVQVIFGEGADDILAFGKNASTSVGLANSEFNQLSAVTGALLKDTGKPLKEVAGLTTDLAVRAADMASVMNTDVQDALSAINQALRGETEAIRRYTGDVTEAALEQYVLEEGLNVVVGELSEQEKRLLRLQVVMKQTEKFSGDFANTSGSLANQQRMLAAEFEDVRVEIGNQLLPIMRDHLLPFMRNQLVPFISGKMVPWLGQMFEGINVVTDAWDDMTTKMAEVMIWFDKLGGKVETFREKHPFISGDFMEKLINNVTGRQVGGIVTSGQPYIVGERGPEMFVPHTSGKIEPSVTSTGGNPVVNLEVNIGMYAGTEIEKRNIAKQLYSSIVRLAQSQNKTVAELMGG